MTTTTTSATSATGGVLQSLGIGSGIDIQSLVSQLTTSEMSADNSRIARQTQQVGTQISAVASLKGALSTFQTALTSLNTASSFQVKATSSADDTIFTATAAANATAGTYQVEVQHLAQSQQLLSTPIAGDGSQALGTGSLTLTVGTKSFTVAIDGTHASLNDIRNAINAASDNAGVAATIVHGASGAQLVLSSTATGAANTIAVTTDGGDGGLARLTYGSGNTTNYREVQGAQDALIKVAGVENTSPSNVVTGAIDGVTLNLLAAKQDTPISLNITNDTSTVANRVQTFVDAYNKLQSVVAQLGDYDSSSQTAGPLLGDAMLVGLSSQVRRYLTNPVSSVGGQYNSLASLGITTNKDGTLSLDTTKLGTALKSNFAAVSSVFTAADGVATQLSKYVDDQLSTTGNIASRNKTLTQQQKDITDQQAQIAARTAQVQARLTAQFTAMDTVLAQMQQTSSYLTQQFATLSKITSGSGNSSSG